MKKILLLISCLSSIAFANGDFCEGFSDGYQEGYCDGNAYCVKPIPPICPIPNIGESTFRDGYNRGFKEGLRKKRGAF